MENIKEQVELALGEKIGDLLHEQMAETTEKVTTRINDDTILVRFQNVLSPAEKCLMQNSQGAESLKQLKERLIKNLKPALENIIRKLTDSKVTNIHTSINIESGERIMIFSVDKNLEEKFI